MDFGKQVGPLPLGAWIAVVGVGGAVALYSRKSTTTPTASGADVQYEDVSGDSGVGTGAVGGWVTTTPPSSTVGDTVTAPTDNIEWGRRAVNLLINDGYDAAQAQSAITKALASGEAGAMSVSEWTLWRVALMKLGSPPEPVYTTEPSSAPDPVTSTGAPDKTTAVLPPPPPAPEPVAVAAPPPPPQVIVQQVAAPVPLYVRRAVYLVNHPTLASLMGYPVKRWQWLKDHPIIANEWAALGGSPGHP